MAAQSKKRKQRLPEMLRPIFWEYRFSALNWREDRDLVISRILVSGEWKHLQWLRRRVDDTALRDWIERRRGRGLSPKQLRFWELMLNLSHRQVNAWLRAEGRKIWDQRVNP